MRVIDGYMPTSADVAFPVDDVYTTGDSLRYLIGTVRSFGAQVNECGVIVTRARPSLDVPVFHLYTEEQFF